MARPTPGLKRSGYKRLPEPAILVRPDPLMTRVANTALIPLLLLLLAALLQLPSLFPL